MKQFESFRLDTANECLWRDRAQIPLPPKPYAILRYLVEHAGRLITHDELLDALWPETYVQPQVLRTYMLELRKVLGDDAGAPRFIQTLPKRGYCFVAPVSEAPAPADKLASAAENGSADDPGKLVDRNTELGKLESLLGLVAAGQRQIVLITGAAGIGKTALVDAFVARTTAAGRGVAARGQCVEGLGGREEYYPVMEALSRLCASVDCERVRRVLTRVAPHWLPANEDQTNSAHPAAAKMPGDLCAALEELASERPLLLVLEDVHWADHSTCALVSALARRRAPAKLMVLVTCRPQEGSAVPSLKGLRQDLLVRRLCVEIALAPFGRVQVGKLISRHLGQDTLPAGLDEFVYLRSEGNPLFVIAMLEHLIAQRYLFRETADGTMTWRQTATLNEMGEEVPDELAQMIELEIERLSASDQRLLEAASLMPVAFPAWAVAAALGEDPVDTEEACDEVARRLYFLRKAGQDELPDGTRSGFYVFAHGLYREVLYARQAAARRARRHVRIAERLAQLFAGRESSVAREVALHYEAAGDWQRAAQALRAAAESARAHGADSEAAALLDQARSVAENLSESDRTPLLEQLRADASRLASGQAVP